MGAACGCASKKASYDGTGSRSSGSVVSNRGGVQVGSNNLQSGPKSKELVRECPMTILL